MKKLFPAVAALIKAKFFGIGTPLIVGWALTYRCNRDCAYCGLPRKKTDELTTGQIFKVIDELAGMGTIMISFTGGEPMVRDDIGAIIGYAHGKGIIVKLNSNGSFIKKRAKELKGLDVLTLSLDGPEGIHDAIRGNGSYRDVIEAASVAREAGIKVGLVTTLSRHNLGSIDYVLARAAEFGCKVTFQPASGSLLSGDLPDPAAPGVSEYRAAVEKLIDMKKRGDRRIGNSLSVLRHLHHWPEPVRIACAGGAVTCRIEPNGDVVYCGREKTPLKALNCIRDGTEKAFRSLKPMICRACWCANRVELNKRWG